jgi:hypothetical protein
MAPETDPGLCRDCRHGRRVPGRATLFWLCERAAADPSFPRYPRLPVLRCRGYEPPPETGRYRASARSS